MIIAGSRPPKSVRYNPALLYRWYVDNMHHVYEAVVAAGFDITEEICGDAEGFDKLGERWADRQHPPVPVRHFPAAWTEYGKRAGFVRNAAMAEYSHALIAITYGTGGTANMIEQMERLSKPHYILSL